MQTTLTNADSNFQMDGVIITQNGKSRTLIKDHLSKRELSSTHQSLIQKKESVSSKFSHDLSHKK